MKIKVSTAEGATLDWMVTYALHGDAAHYIFKHNPGFHRYSTDWQLGGPILTREHISRTIDHSGLWIAYWTDGYTEGDEGKKWMQCDRIELVAGLRCFVVSKLGEEVEVPDGLA